MPGTHQTRAAVRVPHICPQLADGEKAEGPASDFRSPVLFFPITSAVHDAHSADPASISAESTSNSADCVSNAAVSQLTSSQSSSPIAAVNASNAAVCVTTAAESHLTCSQPHTCCRAHQHNRTSAESITTPQKGGREWGVGGAGWSSSYRDELNLPSTKVPPSG